jgi:hypothetical protein
LASFALFFPVLASFIEAAFSELFLFLISPFFLLRFFGFRAQVAKLYNQTSEHSGASSGMPTHPRLFGQHS